MRRKNTESIGEVIKQFFEENRFIRAKVAESRVLTGWGKILGPSVSSFTTNIYLKNNILYVSLSSSVLRAELIMSKERIIANLNKYAEMDIVKEIIFR